MRREWPRPESCGGSQPISSTEIAVSERSIGRVQDLRSNRLNSIIEPSVQRSSAMDDLPPPTPRGGSPAAKPRGGRLPVRSGRITMEEALRRDCNSPRRSTFLAARRSETRGLAGLRATRVQQYRRSRPPRGPRSRRCFHRFFGSGPATSLAAAGRESSAELVGDIRRVGSSSPGTERRYGAGGEEWQLRRCMQRWSATMPQPNDLSRSLVALAPE